MKKSIVKNILAGAIVLAFGTLNVFAMDVDPSFFEEVMPFAYNTEIAEYSGVEICNDGKGSVATATYSKRGLISGAKATTTMKISSQYAASDCDAWVWANIQRGDATAGNTSETINSDFECTTSASLKHSEGNAYFTYHSALLNVNGSQVMSGSYNGATGTLTKATPLTIE